MKKISHILIPIALAIVVFSPISISAQQSNCNGLLGSQYTACITNGGTLPAGSINFPLQQNTVQAQTFSGGGNINVGVLQRYKDSIVTIINSIFVPVLFAVAFLYFLVGVYKYFILGAAEEEQRTKGKQFVLWGLIGFAVILSVWGLVAVVTNTLGVSSSGGAPTPPIL